MTLLAIVAQVLVVVLAMLLVGGYVLIGQDRILETRQAYRQRLEAVSPYLGVLAVVLVANKIARDVGPDLSWLIGVRITDQLHRMDGLLLRPVFPAETPQVVVWLQSMATQELTAYFSFAYVYGYVFLLVFPLVAYLALPEPEPLRRTMVAYAANYLIGVACYVAFIAYGPRNIIADDAVGLLYVEYSQYQFITTEINDQTNVFPSLHASLAVTALLLAWSTREEYPEWVPIAAVLAVSVILSTMYLGIHWATDVVFGVLLGWFSVRLGRRYEDRPPEFGRVSRGVRAVRNAVSSTSR